MQRPFLRLNLAAAFVEKAKQIREECRALQSSFHSWSLQMSAPRGSGRRTDICAYNEDVSGDCTVCSERQSQVLTSVQWPALLMSVGSGLLANIKEPMEWM